MTNTTCNVLLSILNTKDTKFIQHKLKALSSQLELTEVEKKIIEQINNSIQLGSLATVDFIRDKFSYYTEQDPNSLIEMYLEKGSIDSAITDIKANQLKLDMSKRLIGLGGKIEEMTIDEIKESLASISRNNLIENVLVAPENGIQLSDNAYAESQISKDGMSLVIPKIEEHAGKAAKGSVVTIAAFTSAFKSTFALNVAYENALAGYNILYLVLEDTEKKMFNRLVLKHLALTASKRSELINSADIRDGKATNEQINAFNKAHNDLVTKLNNRLLLWDSTKLEFDNTLEMTNILRLADKKFMEDTGKGLDAIVVDQVSLLKYKTGIRRNASYDGAVINDWVSYFREQSLNFLGDGRQTTVFIVTQTSREAFAEASKPKRKGRYEASCSSDSHEIERATFTMITLFKDYENKNTLLIGIPKAREGYTTDYPIQVEMYPEYFHIGPLNFHGEQITAEDFSNSEIKLEDLIQIA